MDRKYIWFGILAASSITIIVMKSLTVKGKSLLEHSVTPSVSINLPLTFKSLPSPSHDWDFSLSNSALVLDNINVPIYQWFPDGHISVLQDGSNNWIMFWSEFESYRSIGSAPYPETQVKLSPDTKVFGGRGGDGWDNGGSWLNSVFRLSDNNLIGFYHAEYHWNPLNPNGVAWKSIAVTYSSDNGITWASGEQIITAWKTRPTNPEWGGAGDHSVVWDPENQRWVCYYQEQVEDGQAQIHVAISSDVYGGPGSWYKWDGTDFTIPAIGGQGVPIPAFTSNEGGNPSVHQNTYLGKWIIVYGGWDGAVYISSSTDMINWDRPIELLVSDQGGRAWYPTIIGDGGDTLAGQIAHLYYADIAIDFTSRKFYMRTITFTRND